jgi:hypothetical protein
MTTTIIVAAGTTSGAGALAVAAIRFRWLERLRRRTTERSLRRKS